MPTVITEIESRNDLLPILENNPGVIVIKLGAEWCGPCKLIEKEVHDFFENVPSNVLCGDLDVDESFDLYAYLKQKKLLRLFQLYFAIVKTIRILFLMMF